MDKVTEYISHVENAIQCADNNVTKLTNSQFSIVGMSSRKIRIFLNEMIKQDTNYLEIGVWCGSTFTSALYANQYKSAIAIDNFSEFTEKFYLDQCKTLEDLQRLAESELNIIHNVDSVFLKNCSENDITNFKLIESDCFNLSQTDFDSIKDVNVYLYDGGHSIEDQRKALTYYINNLSDVFIFIVDDWNFPDAKIGTRLGIQETNIKIHKEWELQANVVANYGNGDLKNWWNGYYVAVCEKQK